MIRRPNTSSSAGFTLVELSLAMAFIAVLLLAVAMLTMQIGSIYRKGLTIRAVNQAGQLISTDMERTLNTSSVQSVATAGDATGARLCAGTMVYAWNYGASIDNNDPNIFNKFGNGFGAVTTPQPRTIRMVKFLSLGIDYCHKDPLLNKYAHIPSTATDLLSGGDVDLVVHKFSITMNGGIPGQPVTGDTHGEQRLYLVSITIGSNEQAILNGDTTGCQQSGTRVDDEYCAINQFTFTSRAGHRQG